MKRKGRRGTKWNGVTAAPDKCTKMSFMSWSHPDGVRKSGLWDNVHSKDFEYSILNVS